MQELKFKDTPYIIKQKKYSTIELLLIFPCEYDKNNIFDFHMIRQLLLNTSEEYETEEKYRKAYKENMIISQTLKISTYNKNTFLSFGLLVPDPKKVKNYDFEAAFKFFIDTIYKPNVKNNKFNLECFEREKEYLKEDIQNSLKNIHTLAHQKFINIVDDNGILKENIYNNMDLIEKSKSEEVYKKYKKYILNNKPIIMIYGNVDKKIEEIVKKYIKIENKEIIINKYNTNYLIPFKAKKDIEEKSKYNQSFLYVAYKIKNMKKSDQIYLKIIKDILSTSPNNLVFKELRNNLGLIYSSDVWYCKEGLLVIESYINNKSKDKVIEGIENILKKLKNKELLEEYINKRLEYMKFKLIRNKDSRVKKFNDFIAHKLKTRYTDEELMEKYKNIDLDKLLEFLNRLTMDTIYFLRGEFNE